jgi:hypothetical protein
MLDTTPVIIAITRLIGTGTTEEALLAAVTRLFPNLTQAELSKALEVAQAAAERKALQAAALLRFLRRVDTRTIEYILNSAGE